MWEEIQAGGYRRTDAEIYANTDAIGVSSTNEGDPAVMKGKIPALMQEISTLIEEGIPRTYAECDPSTDADISALMQKGDFSVQPGGVLVLMQEKIPALAPGGRSD